jgi:hypothetical protein
VREYPLQPEHKDFINIMHRNAESFARCHQGVILEKKFSSTVLNFNNVKETEYSQVTNQAKQLFEELIESEYNTILDDGFPAFKLCEEKGSIEIRGEGFINKGEALFFYNILNEQTAHNAIFLCDSLGHSGTDRSAAIVIKRFGGQVWCVGEEGEKLESDDPAFPDKLFKTPQDLGKKLLDLSLDIQRSADKKSRTGENPGYGSFKL